MKATSAKGILAVLICLSPTVMFSQDFKLNEVTLEELQETHCPFDSSASAYVIFDWGRLKFSETAFSMQLERKQKIKILTEDGLSAANISVLLFGDKLAGEDLSNIKAITYNLENGEIVKHKMHRENMFREEFDEYRYFMKFALPKVKKGSIVEISYTLRSPYISSPPSWKFQGDYPIEISHFEMTVPADFKYGRSLTGSLSVISEPKEQKAEQVAGRLTNVIRSVYVAHDVPPFVAESFISSSYNYIGRIKHRLQHINVRGGFDYEFIDSWKEVDEAFLRSDYFGSFIKPNKYSKEIARELIDLQSSEDTTVQLFNAIARHYKWNSKKRRMATESSFKRVWNDSISASSADMNLSFILLMRSLGKEVHPVLISTRENGYINSAYPGPYEFDYVIARMLDSDGNQVLIDLVADRMPMGMIPYDCLNSKGRIINAEGHGQWIEIHPPASYKVQNSITIKVLPEKEEMQARVARNFSGYAAADLRSKIHEYGNEIEAYNKIMAEHRKLETDSFYFENVFRYHEKLSLKIDCHNSSNFERIGDKIFIQPFIINHLKNNPFKAEHRKHPVDLGFPLDYQYFVTVNIPEGYQVEYLPENLNAVLPERAGRLLFQATPVGSSIQINVIMQINKVIFSAEQYAILHNIYDIAESKMKESLIFSKLQ